MSYEPYQIVRQELSQYHGMLANECLASPDALGGGGAANLSWRE